jgi:hypothetical protein
MNNPPLERWRQMLAVNPRLSAQLAKEANVTENQLPRLMASMSWAEAADRIKTAMYVLLEVPPALEEGFRFVIRPAGFFTGAAGL